MGIEIKKHEEVDKINRITFFTVKNLNIMILLCKHAQYKHIIWMMTKRNFSVVTIYIHKIYL